MNGVRSLRSLETTFSACGWTAELPTSSSSYRLRRAGSDIASNGSRRHPDQTSSTQNQSIAIASLTWRGVSFVSCADWRRLRFHSTSMVCIVFQRSICELRSSLHNAPVRFCPVSHSLTSLRVGTAISMSHDPKKVRRRRTLGSFNPCSRKSNPEHRRSFGLSICRYKLPPCSSTHVVVIRNPDTCRQ